MGWPGLRRYAGKPVGVLGLARSGLAAARAFAEAGATVLGFDDDAATVARSGLRQGSLADIAGLALLVPSPGVPLEHPVIASARSAGVEIRGDVDLFAELIEPRPIVGITGTNGKSTTTALIHHLLAAAGGDAALGGNIGQPVFELDAGPESRVFVLELSSFQLDLCSTLHPRVAVWLNLTPDHLDRHGSLGAYIAAKQRIFAQQTADDVAVVAVDDEASSKLADALGEQGRRVVRISARKPLDRGVFVVDGRIVDALDGKDAVVADLGGLTSLRGRHNWQNAAAAYAAVRSLGLSPAASVAGIPSFSGLAHRMEEVARAGHVAWVNDSKATNPDAALPSLTSFADIWLIAGGKPKPGGFRTLRGSLGAVRAAYLIGQASAEIARDIGNLVPVHEMGTLGAAVAAASKAARASTCAEAVVLLAPACASFDQFKNFEERGETFRTLAQGEAMRVAA